MTVQVRDRIWLPIGHYFSSDGNRRSENHVNDNSRVVPAAKFFMSTFVICILRLIHIARTSRISWTRTEIFSCWLQEYPDQWEALLNKGEVFLGNRFPVRKSAILRIFWFVPGMQRFMSLFVRPPAVHPIVVPRPSPTLIFHNYISHYVGSETEKNG
jgi:hypothetical protein